MVLLLASGPLAAQQGAIVGRVTNATTLAPVPLARISVVAGARAAVTSEVDGSFELRLAAGVYDLLVEAGDFAPTRFERISVSAGQVTARNLPLESQGYRLAGFIVTASRGALETEITAPSSSHAVTDLEISERPAVSPVEHLREAPGVDIMTQGLQATNVVARGFNNIFSGATLVLTDNRMAGLPSLRANLMHFLPLIDGDIERTEVVLGPGAALYGPNTANGVVHVITKSPLDRQGSTVWLGGGEQSSFHGAFRSAFLVNDEFAVKVSGQALLGNDWPYEDTDEREAKEEAANNLPQCVSARQLRGITVEEAEAACVRVGDRDTRIRRYSFEARADWRFSDRGTLVGTYGRTDGSGIELTGLGAVQTRNWIYEFAQARLTYDRWFVQAYFNANDAGETFMLRDGVKLVDRSVLGVVQVQNSFGLADGRQDFTYGWDYFATQPNSQGTIYGDYEDDDAVREWGVYLQSKTALTSKVDLIAAGRIDSHSILPDLVYSPRLALILKPNEDNAIRFAYNRAFSTPTALNYFLDISGGYAKGGVGALGFSERAFGTGRHGFSWQNPDGSLRGMRSPFNPAGAGQLLSVDQATLWQLGLGFANQASPLQPDILDVLRGLTPGATDVGIAYLDTNNLAQGLQPLSGLVLPDVPAIRESSAETFEVGWSGVLWNRLRISADVYHTTQKDFVSPLVVETPLLFLDGADIGAWLGPAYVAARTQDLVDNQGMSASAAQAQATAEASTIVPALASGIGATPLAVATSDVAEIENGGADLIATYRNVGDLSLWGADLAVQWSLTPLLTLSTTYSHVSKNWFEIEGGDAVALNAPADKGTLSLAYRDEALGLNASARLRYTGPFPVRSTGFNGNVDEYSLVDLTLGYKVPRSAITLQVAVSNVLDTDYRSFVGVPSIGRLTMARVRYDF